MPELVHPAQLDPRLADLERPQSTGVTGGLCRALAERWQVDPIIVRLVALALTFAGGVGVALYAWGWLLTPRVGGTPPILRWLPAFGTWPQRTQAIIIAVSSLVLVLSIARQTGVGWGPVIVLGALAWAMARRRRTTTEVSTTDQTGHSPAAAPRNGARNADESVEQWRARLSPHAGSPLPAVDLYAPEASRQPHASVARKTRQSSWLAGLLIVVLSVGAGSIPFLFEMRPTLVWASVAATGTASALLLGWTLGARTRRLPHALLILALLGAGGTGFLATAYAAIPTEQTVAAAADPSYTFVGEIPVDVDLTTLPTRSSTVTITATASIVRIRLNEIPQSLEVLGATTHVETTYPRSNLPVGEVDLIIDGDFSIIEVEVVP